jgi:predicted GNAT family N-acyltransferase
VPSLDDWLKRRARANNASGASRTFVVSEGSQVIAYYAIAPGGVAPEAVTGRFRRNVPDPIPVAVLGRFAIDTAWQGKSLARPLFCDCARRITQAAETVGIRGILVHAISVEVRDFYAKLGFEASPIAPLTLMMTLADVRAGLGL